MEEKSLAQKIAEFYKKTMGPEEVPLMVNGKIVNRADYPQFSQPEQQLQPYKEPKVNPYVNPQEGIEDLKKVFSPEEQQKKRFEKLVK